MKKAILNCILLFPLFMVGQKYSEDFTVTKSTPYEVVDARTKDYVAVGDGYTMSLKSSGSRVVLQKFDVNGMKETKRKVYEDFPKYNKTLKLLKVKDHLYYVYESYNKSDKTFSIFSREIDIKNTTFKEQKKLFTTKGKVTPTTEIVQAVGFFGYGAKLNFSVIPSEDGSKVLIRYRNTPEKKSDKVNYDNLGFYVFDNEFNKIWGNDVKMPYTEREMNNIAYSVKNDGDAIMLARINESKTFELITISKGEMDHSKLAVKDGLLFDSFYLKEKNDGNIIACGYYANTTNVDVNWFAGGVSLSKNIEGLYIFEIKKNGDILTENKYPFSLDFIKLYMTGKQKKKVDSKSDKGKPGMNGLLLREFNINKDGSIIVVGEVVFQNKEMWTTSFEDVMHYENLVITKIASNGELAWQKKLPKNQAALYGKAAVGGMGITYVQGSDAHYILFVDNIKNINLSPDKGAAQHRSGVGGYLTAYRVDDKTGEVDKHLILNLTDIEGVKAYQFYISRMFEAAEKTFLLEFYIKKKKDMTVKMVLD